MSAVPYEATYDSPDESWARLREVLKKFDIALFLGAGLTMPNRLPSWVELTARLSSCSPAQVKTLQAHNLALTTQLQLARAPFSSSVEWADAVREALYRDFTEQVRTEAPKIPGLRLSDFGSGSSESRARVRRFFELRNPLLLRIVEACGVRQGGRVVANDQIGAILTTNFDGLLQICDRACHGSPRMLRTVERAHKNSHAEKISLYHLHGYLHIDTLHPEQEAADRLVLTEDEYLERNDNPYSWANVILHWALREFPIVFVGCSMTDELVRRALRRSMRERLAHAAADATPASDSERRWRRQFALTKLEDDETINRRLNAGLAFLGVWPLWIRDFNADLMARLLEIGLTTGGQ